MRPLIAVAGYRLPPGRVSGWATEGAAAVPESYVRALHRAGAQEAILLPVTLDEEEAAERLSRFDGLLVTGGGDVDPRRYGADPRPEVYGVQPERDAFEMGLLRAAIALEVPTLAVCRGIQTLNVALGGSLHQHLPGDPRFGDHKGPGHEEEVSHPVRLEPGSRTAKAMGVEAVEAVSAHHQAVAALGRGLRAVGWSLDGLVEAVEAEGEAWVVGVQWHPERSADRDPAQQGLFDALAEQAGSRAPR